MGQGDHFLPHTHTSPSQPTFANPKSINFTSAFAPLQVSSKFSGFRSLWMIFMECMWATADVILRTSTEASSSDSIPDRQSDTHSDVRVVSTVHVTCDRTEARLRGGRDAEWAGNAKLLLGSSSDTKIPYGGSEWHRTFSRAKY